MKNQVKYKAFAYTLALDWSIAEDAVQEAAVYVCDHFDQFELGTNFDAWARAIVRNRCREIFRREHREKEKANRIATIVPDAVWEDVSSYDGEKLLALHTCLENIPSQTRQVVEMFYGGDKKCNFISEALQLSEEAVYKMLSRVRKSLKNCIENRMKEAAQ